MSNLYRVQKGVVSTLALVGVGISAQAFAAPVAGTQPVVAKYESQAFLATDKKADADDPAIWVNTSDKSKSLVIGTLKQGGLVVMNLQGQTIQRISAPPAPTSLDQKGRYNNVDLLLGFSLGGTSTDLAIVSDRGRDKLVAYKINKNWSSTVAPLTDVTAATVPFVFSADQTQVNEQRTAYGLAVKKGSFGSIGFVTQRERANIRKVTFQATSDGKVTYTLGSIYSFPSSFTLPNGQSWTPCADEDGVEPQFEGMVIDKDGLKLYAAQETVGIWRMNLDGSSRALVEKTRSYGVPYTRTFDPVEEEYSCTFGADPGYGGTHITADAEGLTIWYHPTQADSRFLSASSQGDNTFSIFDVDKGQWEYEGTYQPVFAGTDVNEESDGSDVVSTNLGSDYPWGLLVTQDGNNTPDVVDATTGEVIANTNFKFTSFKNVIDALDLDY